MHRAREATSGVIVAERLRLAHTHWTRLKGLLGTRELPPGEGLWIKPCKQIHMFGMRYAVDLAFLDERGRVVRTVEGLRPSSFSPRVPEATSVLELPVGTIARAGIGPRSAVEIDGEVGARVDRLEQAAALACNIALAALYALFAAVHMGHARRTGEWTTTLPIVIQEALLVGLFLARRQSLATSLRPFDWVVGIVGTFLPLSFRTTGASAGLRVIGAFLQIGGLAWAVAGALSLGRSIGIVAGNRGVKTGGLYRLVRHPMYIGYMLSDVGYVASYPTVRNLLILAVTLAALNARAIVEERFLKEDPTYCDYFRRVRWRFIPHVY